MKLSTETLNVLRNFASINPNLVVKPGSGIKTIAESKTVLASAQVTEEFPVEFGIYDLNSFLSVVGMIEEPEFNFDSEGNGVTITNEDGSQSFKYFFSDASVLTTPSKDISMPSCEVEFSLSDGQLNSIRKAATALSCTDVVVLGEEGSGEVTVEVTDVKVSTANRFKLNLGEIATRPESGFKLVFNINNFKFLPGDMNIKVSSRLISEFENVQADTKYWVALEKNSTFA